MRPGDTPIRNTDTPNVQATTVPCSIIAVVWFSSWISSLIVYACCSGCPSPLRSTGSRCPRKGASIQWQLCSVPSLASAAVCYRPQLRAEPLPAAGRNRRKDGHRARTAGARASGSRITARGPGTGAGTASALMTAAGAWERTVCVPTAAACGAWHASAPTQHDARA